MRGAFGLVSLLVCAAIVAYVWATYTPAISKSGTQAKDQAIQLSGHDANGESALKSITTQADNDAGGHLKGLLITDLVPGGAMEKFYGFKKGDKIITEGDYEVDTNDAADLASAELLNAFQRSQQVVVIRDGQHVTLPLPAVSGSAVSQPPSQGKVIQDQLNDLQKSANPPP